MISSVEISFSLSAEGHYQLGQLTFVHDACYDASPSRLVELNSSLQLGSCLSLDDFTRVIEGPRIEGPCK